MKHNPNFIKSHSGIANGDGPKIPSEIEVDFMFLHFGNCLKGVTGMVEDGERVVRLKGKIFLKVWQSSRKQEL